MGHHHHAPWANEVESSVLSLQQRNLLRMQRPTLPQPSSVEALIHERDLEAWAASSPPLPNSVTLSTWRQAGPQAHAAEPTSKDTTAGPRAQGDTGARTKEASSTSTTTTNSTGTAPPPTPTSSITGTSDAPRSPPAGPFLLLPPPYMPHGHGALTLPPSAVCVQPAAPHLPHQQHHGQQHQQQQQQLQHKEQQVLSVQGQQQHQQQEQHFQGQQHAQPDPPSLSLQGESAQPPAPLRRIKLFSLNDYMGLSAHPEVMQAAAAASAGYGMGARSSGVVGGTSALHRELEEQLARLKGTQDCLLCPTGYAANVAVLTALTSMGGRHVTILSDALNHASIIDGSRLACRGKGASLRVYRHNDMAHLEEVRRHVKGAVDLESIACCIVMPGLRAGPRCACTGTMTWRI